MSKKVIEGGVDLSDLYLEELPDFLSDVEVKSYFYCGSNKLTSLSGAPHRVGSNFHCNSNRLTSLEGAPKYVGRDFYCINNPVKFTEEQVRAVCEVGGEIYV